MTDTATEAELDFTAPPTEHGPLTCASCQTILTNRYWSANGTVLCEGCKDAFETAQRSPAGSGTGRLSKALLFGSVGMLAGSAVWYAVAKLANLEVGIIAILLGFLVGRAVFVGSGSRGGRGYQFLAVGLTYLGIGLSYAPFAYQEFREAAQAQSEAGTAHNVIPPSDSLSQVPADQMSADAARLEAARLDSLIAASEAGETQPANQASVGAVGVLLAAGVLLLGILSLPVLVTIGGFPGSLISVLIYSFAIVEAWKLNRAVRVAIAGPYEVIAEVAA